MQPFIVIRNYHEDDELKCQELITLQFIVITWALFFIFLGVPLLFCAFTVPGCFFFLFTGTYFSFYAKAVELMAMKPSQSLVAECYEPFIFRCDPNEASYQIFIENCPYEEAYMNKFRRRIVATISVKNHHAVYNAAWIYRFALAPNYPHEKIMGPMLGLVVKNCLNGGYATLECTISEWQENERDFYDNMGFATRQIYHKQIIGSTVTVMKTQMTYNLRSNEALSKQN